MYRVVLELNKIKMLSIPEIASEIMEKSRPDDSASSTIFFVGAKSVGKSTLINSFLDKNDQVRETLILEYSFGRKSNQKQRLDKKVCHVWEYGGKHEMLKTVITSVPFKGNSTYCIMVDLGKIRSIWNTLEVAIKTTEELIPKPINFEVVIIGGKYDLYKNYDNEIKKLICTTLRSVALIKNCSLFFYSSKDPSTAKRAKEVLQGVGFGNGFPSKDKVTSLSKPLFIPKGTDSWEIIGMKKLTFEEVKSRHLSIIPLEAELTIVAPARGPPAAHAEPFVDAIVDSKLEEIRSIGGYFL